ncbi:MAG: hypothetical protein WKF94_19895 [Solirubrobacteraceae bacterium]
MLAACGSGEQSETGSSAAPTPSDGAPGKLTEAELIAQGDAICRDAGKTLGGLAQPESSTDYSGVERYGEELASAAGQAAGKLKILSPPDSVKFDYDAFVKVGGDQVEDARAYVAAGKAKRAGRIRAILAEFRTTNAEASRLARKVGFEVCGGV